MDSGTWNNQSFKNFHGVVFDSCNDVRNRILIAVLRGRYSPLLVLKRRCFWNFCSRLKPGYPGNKEEKYFLPCIESEILHKRHDIFTRARIKLVLRRENFSTCFDEYGNFFFLTFLRSLLVRSMCSRHIFRAFISVSDGSSTLISTLEKHIFFFLKQKII